MFNRLCLAALFVAFSLCLFALPTWTWVDTYGSTGIDSAEDMTTDNNGNVYLCGNFKNTIVFDASHSLTATGTNNMFLCKLSPAGIVQWAIQNTNSGTNQCLALAMEVDSENNVYLCGSYVGPMGLGGFNLTNYVTKTNAFFAKVNAQGIVQWLRGGGGTGYDKATAVAIDPLGNPVFGGVMEGSAIFGSTTLTSQGGDDIFLLKFDTDGGWLNTKRFGGANKDVLEDIAIHQSGSVYLTGEFTTATVFDTVSLTEYSGRTVFVAKLDSSWNTQWCSAGGGIEADAAKAIVLGTDQKAYITGVHAGSAVFGGTTLPAAGSLGIFTAALDVSGNWIWASSLGANDSALNQGSAILLRTDGDIIVTGKFAGTFSALDSDGTAYDLILARLNPSGEIQWAVRAGGTGNDSGNSLAICPGGGYYIYGSLNPGASFGSLTTTCESNDLFLAILTDGAGVSIPQSPGQISIQRETNSCHLSWSPVTQAVGGEALSGVQYRIYRASQASFTDETLAGETGANSFVETMLTGNHYFYRVTAYIP